MNSNIKTKQKLSKKLKTILSGICLLVIPLLMLVAPTDATALQTLQLNVGNTEKQALMGFGASQPLDQQRLFTEYGVPRVTALANAVYGDLGMGWVRLWVHTEEAQNLADMKDEFYTGYITDGYLDIIKAAGVTHILLAPAMGEGAPTESMSAYAVKLAQFILDIYTEHGVRVEVTGLANEPQGWTPTQISDAVGLLRAELDSRGLTYVGIIAPESASADDTALNAINGIKANSASWSSLLGIATHSYNMGATYLIEDAIVGTNKQYWQTEAGQSLPLATDEQPGNTEQASTAAARFLSDMNNAVTHWMWFIGIGHYDTHPANDSGQVLARPDETTGGIKYNTEYHYLKQLRDVFKIGAVFREVLDPAGDRQFERRMTWGYGQKPAITVAMAKDTTGFWGIGIINTTGVTSNGQYSVFYPADTYQVVINLPVQAYGKVFQVYRSATNGLGYSAAETITANCDILMVTVGPKELVTLKSTN
jgi:hypothetical protein